VLQSGLAACCAATAASVADVSAPITASLLMAKHLFCPSQEGFIN
jgi:hypothetical protein